MSELERVIYCVVPEELAAKLHEPLREHFAGDPAVEVIVERRSGDDRRRGSDRRDPERGGAPADERRRIRHPADAGGRRIAGRRAEADPVDFPAARLPRAARRHAGRLSFVERVRPADQEVEDLDTARLVTRLQAGERRLLNEIYLRYYDRVYAYLRIALDDPHEAEDATQEVFLRIIEAIPDYEIRSAPFRGWLFKIVRNYSINYLRRRGRIELAEPEQIDRLRDSAAAAAATEDAEPLDDALDEPLDPHSLTWITDTDLTVLVDRLPPPQRQLIALRYMMGLDLAEIAVLMERSPAAIRQLHHRALAFLEQRLTALGRDPRRPSRDSSRAITRQAWVVRGRKFALMQ